MKNNKVSLVIWPACIFIAAILTLSVSHNSLSARGEQHCSSTPPRAEILVMDNDTLFIAGDFSEDFPLGELVADSKYSTSFEALVDTFCWSSACDYRRNFIGAWEVIDERLHLKEIRYCCGDTKIELQRIFEDSLINENGVEASWVNGEFYVTDHFDFLSFFLGERDQPKMLTLKVENGTVVEFKSDD